MVIILMFSYILAVAIVVAGLLLPLDNICVLTPLMGTHFSFGFKLFDHTVQKVHIRCA